MRSINRLAAGIVATTVGNVSALAQSDFESSLRLIRETAADICYTVEQRGQKSDRQLQGEVQAKVTGVIGKVLDLGATVGGQIRQEEYQGLSQDALGEALKVSTGCRERVFDKLIDRIPLSAAKPGDPVQKPAAAPAARNAPPGTTSFSLKDDETTFLLDGRHWFTFEHGRTANAGCIRVALDGTGRIHCVGKSIEIQEAGRSCSIIYLGTKDGGATANFTMTCKER